MIAREIKSYWPLIAASTICAVLLGYVTAVYAKIIGPLLKAITSKAGQISVEDIFGPTIGNLVSKVSSVEAFSFQENAWLIPSILVILGFIQWSTRITQTYCWEYISEKIAWKFRNNILGRFTRFQKHKKKQSISTLVNIDCNYVKSYVTKFIGGSIRELLKTVFLVWTLFILSWQITLTIFALGIPVVFLIKKLGKKFRRRNQKALSNFSQVNEWLEQRLRGIKTIKQYKTEDLDTKKFIHYTDEMFKKYKKAASDD